MVAISICDMCKHLWRDKPDNACPAYPEGRSFDECFPYADEECGNGYRFEPSADVKHLWDAQTYKNFSRPSPEDMEWEVCIGEG